MEGRGASSLTSSSTTQCGCLGKSVTGDGGRFQAPDDVVAL